MTLVDKIDIDVNSLPPDGGAALLQRWRRHIWTGRRWVKLYWLAILATVSLTLFTLYAIVTDNWQISNTTFNYVWFSLNAILFIILRFQIGAVGALVAYPFFSNEQFPQIRATDIKTSEIFKAMLRYAFSFDIPVMSIVTVFHMVVFLTAISEGPEHLPDDFATSISWMIVGLSGLIASYVALGYIGSLLIRKPFGAILGVLIPLFGLIGILLGVLIYGSLGRHDTPLLEIIACYILALATPEFSYQMLADDFGGSSYWVRTHENLAAVYWISAVVLWGFVYLILSRRRA